MKAHQSVTVAMLTDELTAVANALKVIVLTPHIRDYLEQHDPKAIEQARTALASIVSL